MNARVRRSTYYCRKATDVLATAAGSVWYSFVDAVTGFNQIANTRRAMEILAIVARSGKFLPVCLTFGPVNGPDDFCFVVDRAYSPGRGRKLKYTKEWVAYVDDLTVRTGRVVDGKFLTDGEADQEIRAACQKAPVSAGQDAASALEALGVNPQGVSKNKGKHDEQVSDHNHPTREVFGVPPKEVLGSRWVHAGLGVLAGSLCAGQRMLAGTCAKRRTFAGNQFRFPRVVSHVFRIRIVFEGLLGVDFRSPFVRFSSHRFHDFHDMSTDFSTDFVDFDFCSLVSGVQQGMEMDWFISPLPFGFSSGQRSRPDLQTLSCCPAGCKKAADMGGGKGKGRKDYHQDVGEMAYVMAVAYRHGKHGHRGYIDSAGWVKVSDSAWLFYVESEWILRAAEHSARSRKPRFEVDGGYIRCIQGHSADAWQSSNEVDLDRLYGRAELDGEVELLHGTDVANVEGIVRFGLLPGGGSVTNRVAVHWIEHAQGGAQPGLRSGSTALVTTKVKYLVEAGITLYRGSENVILTTAVGSEHLREVFAWNYEEAVRGDDLALHDGTALKLIEVEAEVDETGDADVEEGALPTGDTDDEDDSLDQVVSPAVTRDAAAAAASSGSAAPPVKSEAALARAAGVMVSPEEVAASEAATGLGSPAVKADAVAKSSGPAASRDAARRVKGVARRGGPQNRKKIVKKRIVKRDKEVKKLVSYIGQLKLLRESLSRTDPKRPTFQEYTRARADLRRKLPPGTVGDKQYDEFVGVACTTCDDRDTKGKEVVRAFAALRAVRKRRKPGGPLPVVLKPAASAARSEREELEAKFRHIREEDERLEEEERRPPAVVLKGRAVEPAVPQERGETSAKRVVKVKAEASWPLSQGFCHYFGWLDLFDV